MTKREFDDFDLEDIIREFGSASEEETAQEPVQPEGDMDSTVVLPDLSQLELPQEETAADADTMVLPDLTDFTIDEQAIEPPQEELELSQELFTDQNTPDDDPEADTIHLDDELPKAVAPEQATNAEFTQSWDPEEVEQAQEAKPVEPIPFHPQSRLKELKKQLVNGPERRYYALLEKGTGKLQAAIFGSCAVTVLSAGATILHALGWVPEDRLRLMIFGQIFFMLLSALLGSFQLIKGAADLLRKRFSLNTLLGFAFLMCCADAVFCLQDLRIPCCAAFSLLTTMSLWATYHQRTTKLSQLDTVRRATFLNAIGTGRSEDGTDVILRGEGQVSDFMDTYTDPHPAHKLQSIYALCALGLSVAIGVTGGVLHGLSAGFQAAAVSLLAAVPATSFICTTRPLAVLQRRLHKLGCALCGWKGIQGLKDKIIFPVLHQDLFPAGTVRLNGVKYFGACPPEHVAAYAASVATATESGLATLLDGLLESQNGRHYALQELQAHERGFSCKIAGNTVLWGRPSFMKEMDIPMEENKNLTNALCVAVNGELSGIFAISYEKNKAAAAALNTLCAYHKLSPALAASDPMLSGSFLRSKMGANPKHILFPDQDTRTALRHLEKDADTPTLLITTQAGLAPMAFGVTGARSVWTATRLGLLIQLIGGIIGLGAMLTLTILGAFYLLTPFRVFLYQLIWLVPGILITEWTRSF